MKALTTLACLYVIFLVGAGLVKDKEERTPFLVQVFGAITAIVAMVAMYIYAIYTLCQLY